MAQCAMEGGATYGEWDSGRGASTGGLLAFLGKSLPLRTVLAFQDGPMIAFVNECRPFGIGYGSMNSISKACVLSGCTALGYASMGCIECRCFDEFRRDRPGLDGPCLTELCLRELDLDGLCLNEPSFNRLGFDKGYFSGLSSLGLWSPPLNDAACLSNGLPVRANTMRTLYRKKKTPRVDVCKGPAGHKASTSQVACRATTFTEPGCASDEFVDCEYLYPPYLPLSTTLLALWLANDRTAIASTTFDPLPPSSMNAACAMMAACALRDVTLNGESNGGLGALASSVSTRITRSTRLALCLEYVSPWSCVCLPKVYMIAVVQLNFESVAAEARPARSAAVPSQPDRIVSEN